MQVQEAQTTVTDLKVELDKAKTVDGKDLAAWATFVENKWDNIDADIKEQIEPTDQGFTYHIVELKKIDHRNINTGTTLLLKAIIN